MGTRKEVKSMSAEEAEGMEERYIRAREVYTAVSMLMAHPPEGQEERLKEVAIIKAAVEADQFSWPEVLLAGLNDKVADWQRELLEMNSDNEMPALIGSEVQVVRPAAGNGNTITPAPPVDHTTVPAYV